ncbi:ABC transporter substrate-binding protein [Arthrobacter sp. SD76]|uniref:ABC transporter substrate-binding protein n=1 Tax=Arthrobacter sp. SD76 TaxID=3415007 RepID=UPI003C74618A
MKKSVRIVTGLGLSVAAAAALAGCSSSSSGTEETQTEVQAVMSGVNYSCDAPKADTMTDITIAAVPIVSNGALYAGVDRGFFAKHGLNAKLSSVNGLPASIAAVQGGSVNFAFTGTIATFQAIDQGIPLTIVAPFAGIAPKYWEKMQAGEEGYTREVTAILVSPTSGIEDPGDLNGKTVAIADPKGQGELTVRHVINANGGDADTVKFTTMSYADAANALMAGQVDAAYSTEPAMTPAEKAGYKIISWPAVETFHEGPTSAMVASSDYVLKNPEVVARFNCAIQETTAFGRENPDVVRATAAREQKVDPATLAKAVVPYYYSKVDMAGLERFYKIEKEEGFISSDIDLNAVVVPQALNE